MEKKMTTYTFWKLMNEMSIEIPIIQRDYAQGRLDPKTTEIREILLGTILNALERSEPLDFDFVYGSIRKDGDNKVLLPLDGQQRLTTLFLLHWYLAVDNNSLDDTVSSILEKFSYSTRVSSREFCNTLANSTVELSKDITVSKQIREKNWYYTAWDNDPTIKAMLNMYILIFQT